MMHSRLAEATRLREEGRAVQDQEILQHVRTLLLELLAEYPDEAEITYQTAIAHDNLGLEDAAVGYYVQALEQGLSGASLERALMGLGSTYRGRGDYELAEATLRRGVQEFPQNRALQVFLAMTLYNRGQHTEAMEIVLVNLLDTTTDEKLQYFKRPLLYYATHLDET